MKKPLLQHKPAVNMALRGPPSSTQRPKAAAETPRTKIAIEKIQPSEVNFQSSGAGVDDADQPGHRQVENAESIDLTDAQVNAQRGRRHHPAAEPGLRDRMAAVEES